MKKTILASYEELIKKAMNYAIENANDAIYPCHLFKALLHKDMGMVPFLEGNLDKDYYYLVEWADVEISMTPKSSRPNSDLEFSDESVAVLDMADDYRARFGLEVADNYCLLAALTTPGVGFNFNQMKTLPLTVNEVLEAMGAPATAAEGGGGSYASYSSATPASQGSKKAIGKYCINKNELVESGQTNPVVGFEREIASFFEILGRKTKSNMLIIGESGVGKTALVNGFVTRLLSGNVPAFLLGSVVYELDLAALASGAVNNMETEDRFKSVLNELKANGNAILVIEGLDKMMDKMGALYGTSELLKQELNRGGLLVICTATVDGFTKNIETDKEMVRKFEKLQIDEPDMDTCFRIVKGAVSTFEKYHNLTIKDDVITEAIRLAKRYMTEKAMPDSVFDLIDRTMALIKTMNDVSANDVANIEEKLNNLKANPENLEEKKLMVELNWLHYEIMNKVSVLLIAQLDDDTDFLKIENKEKRFEYLDGVIAKLKSLTTDKRDEVLASDLFAVVAKQTGIPLGKVQSKERERLVNAEEILKKRVVGQDHAIKIILDSVFESRSGLNKKGQPMGSFFFLGPTGTGKTELSKALAEFLFQDESSLIRFDMSEFKEEHSVALLYGAPPGYVGYEEGGLLVNKIRQKPYSVVLFDEIEKAHKSVFDLFLQILDEGKLHDRLGRVGDFSNALILFTSNIGSKFIVDSFEKGVIPKNSDLMTIMQDYFRPEFLGRLTEIVPFSPITPATVTRIFSIHLKGLVKLLTEQNINFKISDETKQAIAMLDFSPQFGARPIIGTIRKELRRPLSKLIISGKLKAGDTVEVKMEDKKVAFYVNGNKVEYQLNQEAIAPKPEVPKVEEKKEEKPAEKVEEKKEEKK
ncbi:MAG: ATP-dependent Clp protease ATP-binding subunit [Bacteroidales bacterium]|nr:ATP-dependent Clp protease ATP-binding subunit [Bacteroidales bacterium]